MTLLNPHDLLTHYGSIGLFVALALGIIAFPIPDETLLVFSGFFIAKGKLQLFPILFAAYTGSMAGITISFLIGRTLGRNLILHYGKWIGVTHARLDKAHEWFERFGKWLLIIGYFIPGVRHLIGIVSGTAKLEYWKFAIFAYIGAFIWSSTFLSLGYFFFREWRRWHFF